MSEIKATKDIGEGWQSPWLYKCARFDIFEMVFFRAKVQLKTHFQINIRQYFCQIYTFSYLFFRRKRHTLAASATNAPFAILAGFPNTIAEFRFVTKFAQIRFVRFLFRMRILAF